MSAPGSFAAAARETRGGLLGLLLFAAILATFSNAFRNGATSADDDALGFRNPAVREFSLGALRDVLDPRVPRTRDGFQYTPLSDISYGIDFRLFGDDARPYHLQPLLFHAAAALLLLALFLSYIRRVLGGP